MAAKARRLVLTGTDLKVDGLVDLAAIAEGPATIPPVSAEIPSPRHYIVPVLVALVTVALRWEFSPWLGEGVSTISLLGVVAFSSWYGGTGPAIVAALVGYAANTSLLASGSGSLSAFAGPPMLAGTAVYMLSSGLIILVGRHLGHLTRYAGAADRELRAGKDRWQALLAQSTVGLAGMDLTGRFVFADDRFCEMVGRTRRDLQDLRIDQITHSEDLAHHVALFEHLARDGTPFIIEKRYLRPDGVENWVSKSVFPVRGQDGRPYAAMAVVLDVTERKRAEMDRARLLESERHARASAEQANHMKDEFLAVLSHELRTPLSNVISWSRLLQTKYSTAEPDLLRGLEVIVNNALAQEQLISDLLDLSRIAAGKLVLVAQPLDLMAVVELAVNSQRMALEAKGLRLMLERGSEPSIVVGDSGRLQQVLWNLLSNAIKFTPAGGRIEVRADRVGHSWELTVRDTGEGIAAEFLPHLFDRFRQADGSTTRRYGGLGIGLAIVRQLVELHGGRVRAHSNGPGQGASFTVQLPVYVGQAHGNTPVQNEPGDVPVTGPDALQGVRVLAVEDQSDMREYIRRILDEYGATVTTAASAGEALELLRADAGRFDVLVSDIGMSGLDGYGFIRAVRKQLELGPDRLKAIAVTAFTRDEDRLQALTAGFQVCLSKPYQVTQLVRAVCELANKPAERQPRPTREPRLRLVENKGPP
jgi:PAS domain S-box-containing protein